MQKRFKSNSIYVVVDRSGRKVAGCNLLRSAQAEQIKGRSTRHIMQATHNVNQSGRLYTTEV